MKLVIEIDDSVLRDAVAKQVGVAVSAMADDELKQRFDDILSKKFDRVDVTAVVVNRFDQLMRGEIDKRVKSALADHYGNTSQKVRDIIAEEARKLITTGVSK